MHFLGISLDIPYRTVLSKAQYTSMVRYLEPYYKPLSSDIHKRTSPIQPKIPHHWFHFGAHQLIFHKDLYLIRIEV